MLARGRIMGGRLPVSIRLGEMTAERGAVSRLLIYDLMALVVSFHICTTSSFLT